MRTYDTDWKIVTYINLSRYSSDYEELSNMLLQANLMCDLVKNNTDVFQKNSKYIPSLKQIKEQENIETSCKNSIAHINSMLVEIDSFQSKWFTSEKTHQNKNKTLNRTKRTLWSILALAAFNSDKLTTADGEHFLSEIKALHEQNTLQNRLIDLKTTVLKSSINILENDLNTAKNKINQIYKSLLDISGTIVFDMDIINQKIHINQVLNHITLCFIQFLNNQKLIIDSLAVGQNKNNNANLIPPKIFYNELDAISNEIRMEKLQLPIVLSKENLYLFYQISTVQSCVLDDQLIVQFTLPLTSTETYNLFKATSIPYRLQNNIFTYILPQNEYFAMDELKEKFIAVSQIELQSCFMINNQNLICKQNFPIMYTAYNDICEIKILNRQDVKKSCNIRAVNVSAEFWIKLKEPNVYIYSLPEKQYIQITCPKAKYNQIIENTGIIKLGPGCILRTKSFKIHGFRTLKSKIHRELLALTPQQINVDNIFLDIVFDKSIKLPKITYPTIIDAEPNKELERISISLKQIETLEKQLVVSQKPYKLQHSNGLNISSINVTSMVNTIGDYMPNFSFSDVINYFSSIYEYIQIVFIIIVVIIIIAITIPIIRLISKCATLKFY